MGNRKKNRETLLRYLRLAKGLTCEQMSKKADLDLNVIYRAEEQLSIRDAAAEKISKTLGVPEDLMYYHMGKIPPSKLEYFKKDPVYFMRMINEITKEPWKMVDTKNYIEELKKKIHEQKVKINPDINRIINKLNEE